MILATVFGVISSGFDKINTNNYNVYLKEISVSLMLQSEQTQEKMMQLQMSTTRVFHDKKEEIQEAVEE